MQDNKLLTEEVANEKIMRKEAEKELKWCQEKNTKNFKELTDELENIKRQNSYLATKLREINECRICFEKSALGCSRAATYFVPPVPCGFLMTKNVHSASRSPSEFTPCSSNKIFFFLH